MLLGGASLSRVWPLDVAKGPHDAASPEEDPMNLNNVTCPHCGGLPHNPKQVHLGDAEILHTAVRGVFDLTTSHAIDWRLEAHLTSPDADGTITLTCSDCDRPFFHTPDRDPPPAVSLQLRAA
jgi:hypothetical protein